MKAAGMDAALVLPGDIPLLRAGDVESVLQAAPAGSAVPFAVMVPSHDRMGTNALLLAPPDVLRLRFGHDSFRYHLNEAAARGAAVKVVENSRESRWTSTSPRISSSSSAGWTSGRTHDRLAAMKDNGSSFFADAG